MSQTIQRERNSLYETVAERVSGLIERGTFGAGSRIPSVRALSRQFEVSVTTVLEAYRLLEDRGLIEARPQSGYYVRLRPLRGISEPEIRFPERKPTCVNLGDSVKMVTADMHLPAAFPFGAAAPNSDLLPISRLNRALFSVVKEDPVKSVKYDQTAGLEELRIQIARRALESGCVISPEEIITTAGCQQAVSLCLQAVCRPGDTVAVESPTFYGFLQLIEKLGLRAVEVPTYPRNGICLDELAATLDRHPVRACLVITNYQNPLGGRMPDQKKEQLVQLLSVYDIPLIEDDIYGDLGHDQDRPKTAKAFDREGNVLLCASFSKTIAPGYRVGWTAPGRYRYEVERLKFVNTIASTSLPQMAIAEFLRNGGYDHHLRRVRKVYAWQSARMAEAVMELFPEGTKVTRPTGSFVLWAEMPEYVNSLKLYERARGAGITFAPGPIFSVRQQFLNCIRLNAAYWSERIEGALATIGQLAANMKDSGSA